jgi:vacuolar-type H+-ATPase subunit E/Vma4
MNQSNEVLIAGIEADAKEEEERLLAEAGQQAADKRKYGAQKIEAVRADTRLRSEKQAEEIKRRMNSGVELELRRRSLRLHDAILQDLMKRVEERMKTRITTPGYREVLANWMIEAARGLNVDAAIVNSSAAERELIDDTLLREVMEKLENKVKLTLSESDPLDLQGVVLSSANGRLAYNNQVRTRIRRHRREINDLVLEALFDE